MSQMNSPTSGAGTHAVEVGRDVADDAMERAADVAAHAGEAARDITREAGEQVRSVAGEAKEQAGRLLDQAKDEVGAQAAVQQEKVARGLRSLGDELGRMSMATTDPGYASDLAQRGSQMAGRLAAWFEQREPGDVVREVADFARRRPGVFLAVAAGAGVAAGRLLRGAREAGPDGGTTTGYRTTTSTGYGTSRGAGYGATGTAPMPTAAPAGAYAARERSAGSAGEWPPGDADQRPAGGGGHVPGV